MKSVPENLPYFSAYPLKAINLSEEEYQSELRLWTNGTAKTVTRIRVFPMINPYREKDFIMDKKDTDK
jgi:hypothetical protein